MTYQSQSNVISLGDSKQAALYFDKVVIVDPAEQMGVMGLPGQLSEGAYKLLFGESNSEQDLLRYNYEFQEYRKSLSLPSMSFTRIADTDYFESNTTKTLIDGYINDETLDNGTNIRAALASFAGQMGVDTFSVLLPSRYRDSDQASNDDMSLTLANIPLIDTSKASWEQIFELRKDSQALGKLRNLKMFLQDNYQGKGKDYIEDDLAKRLDKYSDACRDHGLETSLSVLSMVLDARRLQTAIAGGVAAALLGSPLVGLTAAVSIELGQVVLEVANNKHDFNKFKRDHELGYIIDLSDRLNSEVIGN
jgi:hypothetical protein